MTNLLNELVDQVHKMINSFKSALNDLLVVVLKLIISV